MTQVLEPVHIGMMEAAMDKTPSCTGKPGAKGFSARINKGVGSRGDGDPDRLYRHMKKNAAKLSKRPGKSAFVPKAGRPQWRLGNCNQTDFPLQAHHLIPKNTLPGHDVCAFLGTGAKHSLPLALQEDAPYSIDHENNGYCLPYASALTEWSSASTARKRDLAFAVMYRTRRQLHQGSHREMQYTPESDAAEEDDGDPTSDHSEAPGYLRAVAELLDLVAENADDHTLDCKVCKPSAKKEIWPREAIVKHVDQASAVLKVLMDGNRIFVSKRAYAFANLTKAERDAVQAFSRTASVDR